jgi:hypothetical protein
MCFLIHHQEPIAQKDYSCDAIEIIEQSGGLGYAASQLGFSYAELRVLVRARRDEWKIKKGQVYIRQRVTDGGDIWTFRARPEIHEICLRHNLYEC